MVVRLLLGGDSVVWVADSAVSDISGWIQFVCALTLFVELAAGGGYLAPMSGSLLQTGGLGSVDVGFG